MSEQARISRDAFRLDCEFGIEAAISDFHHFFPGWWYTIGECQISCDASIAPTSESEDIRLIEEDDRFNSGFHVDLPQPSTLAQALLHVMLAAEDARLAAREPNPTRKP